MNSCPEIITNSSSKENIKLLVIDENWSHLEELYLTLQMEGFQVYPKTSFEEAQKDIQEIDPHILICSVKRPVLTFKDQMRKLIKKVPGKRIHIIAYLADMSIQKEALKDLNVKIFLKQPFSAAALLAAIGILMK